MSWVLLTIGLLNAAPFLAAVEAAAVGVCQEQHLEWETGRREDTYKCAVTTQSDGVCIGYEETMTTDPEDGTTRNTSCGTKVG